MAKTINSIGSGGKFVTAALMGMGGTSQDKNGRWFVDGQMVDVEISRVIAETIFPQWAERGRKVYHGHLEGRRDARPARYAASVLVPHDELWRQSGYARERRRHQHERRYHAGRR